MKDKLISKIKYLLIIPILILASYYIDNKYYQREYPPRHFKLLDKVKSPKEKKENIHAILVNGAYNSKMNHPRYWNNLSLFYITLKSIGVDNFYILNSDGKNTSVDKSERSFLGMVSNEIYENSELDLDLDGIDDIKYDSSINSLENVLSELSKEIKPEDKIILFFTDHGQLRFSSGVKAVTLMWNEQELTSKELENLLKKYIPKENWITILANQCHGGLFLHHIDRENTIFVASGWPLWIWSGQNYSVFSYFFSEALLGIEIDSLKDIKINKNGIGIFEAFDYAKEKDYAPEIPKIWFQGERKKAINF